MLYRCESEFLKRLIFFAQDLIVLRKVTNETMCGHVSSGLLVITLKKMSCAVTYL